MPTGTNVPLTQDWDAVNVGKSTLNRAAIPKTARGLDAAKAQGKVATELRYVVVVMLGGEKGLVIGTDKSLQRNSPPPSLLSHTPKVMMMISGGGALKYHVVYLTLACSLLFVW
jgi:hypothetical protein